MSNEDPRIMALVEQILDSGCAPEEVCNEHPELLPAVRGRLKKFHALAAEVDSVFPPRAATASAPEAGGSPFPKARAPTPLPDIPGYERFEMIGSGGMGVVFKARHIRLNRDVAIKMLLAGGYAGVRELERFKREAEAVAALRHPNIVQVHDAGEHDGFAYFTMEFMDGGSLSQSIASTPQPARKVAETVATLARAVHAAHTSGIVHRDLKPANVLLTADGTLKIADFGLAGRMEPQGSAVSIEGAALGTPSYMSPEQARGEAHASTSLTPAVDVYALGAILYEMLTGRPPFRGESPVETQRQVVCDDPVPPARLNPRVPRDLETICLKCLEKSPAKRYATALELAEDLDRFLRGEPIRARPVSALERVGRWTRRKPAAAALVMTGSTLLIITAVLGAGAWRTIAKRSAEIAAWTPRLELVRQLERQGKLREARNFLPRPMEVETREIQVQVQDALAELDLARELETVRDARQRIIDGRFDYPANLGRSDKAYEEIVHRAGFGSVSEDPSAVAQRIARSPIRLALVAALDDWSICAPDDTRRGWIMEVARRADPDQTGWRDQVRQLGLSRAALESLAGTAAVQDHSPQLLVAFGERVRAAGGDAVPFLDRVQKQHPGDFWACYTLGTVVFEKLPAEAIRYYQAALASRPESALGHDALGRALSNADRHEEAIPHFRESLRLEPAFGEAMSDLGWALAHRGQSAEGLKLAKEGLSHDGSAKNHHAVGAVLQQQGKLEEAMAEFRRSVEVDPKFFWGSIHLAELLESKGLADEAMAELERCLSVNPESGWVHVVMAERLQKRGRIDDAIKELTIAAGIDDELMRASAHHALGDCWRAKDAPDLALGEYNQALLLSPTDALSLRARREVMAQLGLGRAALAEWTRALEANPELREHWNGYAEFCIYVGDQDAYEKACHRLLDRNESSANPRVWERVGRACLLGVIPPADSSRATALVERAVHAKLPASDDWVRPYFHVAQGLARYRAHDFSGAIESIGNDSRKVLGPLPHLVLAMGYQGAGRRTDALRSFTRALGLLDWDPSRAGGQDEWMFHTIRREAEALILPKLPAFLEGAYRPAENDERLAMLGACQSRRRYADMAGLYAEVFVADPALAEDLEAGWRYKAACAACLASSGQNAGAAATADSDRSRWREQARQWLHADLALMEKRLESGGAEAPESTRDILRHWRVDPDLAGLRDRDQLDRLSDEERSKCVAVWKEADTLLARTSSNR